VGRDNGTCVAASRSCRKKCGFLNPITSYPAYGCTARHIQALQGSGQTDFPLRFGEGRAPDSRTGVNWRRRTDPKQSVTKKYLTFAMAATRIASLISPGLENLIYIVRP
jgi:hypothetical protein